MRNITIPISLIVILQLSISLCFAQKDSINYKPQTLNELRTSIHKVLIATNTPGAGVVMVSDSNNILIEGVGKADVKNNIDANENSIFRLGSISKVFVALAILKLQEDGRLNLKDKIKDIIPEIEYDNPWEDEYPIRIEHLLEHSTGWSCWHFAELGSDDPKPKTLKEALDFYTKSRISDFVPSTRIRESNVGSAVAAYIVEKVSGMSFEVYVDKYLFEPMGMKDMNYLYSEQYKKRGVKLYDNGIELNYFHILYRPAASLNGSPKDMAKLLRFFIHRGKINNNQVLYDASLQRMERSESLGKLSKLKIFEGHGLSNNAIYYKGFIYRGYSGSVPGGNAHFAYLPEYDIGYAVMVNASNEENAVYKIGKLIKYYQTKNLLKKPIVLDTIKYKTTKKLSGYYTSSYSKIDKLDFIQNIKDIYKVWTKNDTLFIQNLLNGKATTTEYIPTTNNEFKLAGTDRITLALIDDPLEGQMIAPGFLKQISPLWAYTHLFIFWSFFVILFTSILFAFIWMLVYLFGKKKNKTALWISLLPFITNSFIFITIISILLSAQSRYDMFQLFGTANPISILLFVCSICYAVTSVWSVYYIFKNWRVKMTKLFYFHSALASVLNLVFMIYFFSNGLIGIPTWF